MLFFTRFLQLKQKTNIMKRHLFWMIYIAFVISVLATNWHSNILSFNQPQAFGKILIWLVFFSFSAYTIYCSLTEHFFKSLKHILTFKWGIQIGTDLEIGLFLSLFIIHWHSGSWIVTMLWIFPCVLFGNLTTLLYFVVHYDALVALFSK
jgi:hypothetical protein